MPCTACPDYELRKSRLEAAEEDRWEEVRERRRDKKGGA